MNKKKEWEELFAEKSEEMSQWRQKKRKATLSEIEAELDQQLAQVRVKMLQDLALESELRDLQSLSRAKRPKCPICERPLAANGKDKRTLITTHEEEVELERSKGYCRRCKISFFPPR